MQNKRELVILLVVLTFTGLFLATSIPLNTVSAATEFSGIIATDTTWAKANSPYTLTGNVLIANGVTLAVEAGTKVNLGSYYIKVNGTLQAIGDSGNQIIFNANLNSDGQITFTQYSAAWNDSTSTGCIIENSTINCPLILSNPIKLSGNIINNRISVQTSARGAPLISNNTIRGGITVEGPGDAIIVNNSIIGSGVSFGTLMNSANITLAGNTIACCSTGITALCWGSPPYGTLFQLIEGNLIVNNTQGIVLAVWNGGSQPIIRNNTITNNTVGISVSYPHWADSPIQSSQILYNNVYGNSQFNFEHLLPTNINASYNWWGTTNTDTIAQSIYDYNEDFELGTVAFNPVITEPNNESPTCIIAASGVNG